MKTCRHKNTEYMDITIVRGAVIANTNIDLPVEVHKPIHLCLDCRCLVMKVEDEKLITKGKNNA